MILIFTPASCLGLDEAVQVDTNKAGSSFGSLHAGDSSLTHHPNPFLGINRIAHGALLWRKVEQAMPDN